MKTLKKNLCLLLAMVMVFGLCTISASAKLEYYDNDAINYEEAVDVLSGLGILVGSGGQFRPTASISRAEAAKVLAYIMIGDATQADALKASSAPFTDVPATHWAAGYIAYCNSRGIILGVGDGSYHPNDNVTGIQFSLMLLRALGYGTQKEYNTSDWPVKVAADAIRLGVFDDNLAGANSDPATREECALYAFNVIARPRLTNVTTGAKREGLLKVTYSALAGDYVANGAFSGLSVTGVSVDANKKATFAEDFGLKYRDAGVDDFEREVGHCWTQTIGNVTKVITGEYEGNESQIAFYSTGVTGSDFYYLLVNAYGRSVFDEWKDHGAPLIIYQNGADTTPFDADDIVRTNTNKLGGTGNGVGTYVYTTVNTKGELTDVKVCTVETYLAKVTNVVTAKANTDAKTTVTVGEIAGNVGSGTGALANAAAKTYTTEEDLGFVKGDYVLVTYAKGKIQSIEPVTVMENTISKFTRDGSKVTFTSGGSDYVPAQVTMSIDDLQRADANNTAYIDKTLVNGKTHRMYLDNYGYVISIADVTPNSQYVYVSEFGPIANHTDGEFDAYNCGAKVYYADGTSAIVKVKTIDDTQATAEADRKTLKWDTGSDKVIIAGGTDEPAPGIYKLSGDVLQALETNRTSENGSAVLIDTHGDEKQVKRGIASSIKSTGLKADSKTVFYYVKGVEPTGSVSATDVVSTGADVTKGKYFYKTDSNNFAVNVYIGIDNVPGNKNDKAMSVTALQKDGAGNAVAVLVIDYTAPELKDTVYLYRGKNVVDETDWTVTYDVYVNGQEDTLTITYGTEKKKNAGVAAITGDFDGKFFVLNSANEPVAVTAGKDYTIGDNKYMFTTRTDITLNTGTDALEIVLVNGPNTAENAISVNMTTVIDLTGNNLTSITDVEDYMATYSKNYTDFSVVLQYGETNSILYIVDIAE